MAKFNFVGVAKGPALGEGRQDWKALEIAVGGVGPKKSADCCPTQFVASVMSSGTSPGRLA